MSLKTLALTLCAVALVACSSSPDKTRLEGERINVVVPKVSVKADPQMARIPVRVPGAVNVEDWTQKGGFANHFPEHITLSQGVKKAWQRSIGAGSSADRELLTPPVIQDNVAYTLNTDAEVYAIDLAKGKLRWDAEVELSEEELGGFNGGLAVAENHVIVTTGAGEIVALDAETGFEIWRRELGVPVRAAPAVSKGKAYIVTHNNRLFVLNIEDGTIAWTHSGIEEELALMGGAAPAIGEGVVIVPYSSGELYALEEATGRYLWHDALAFNVGIDLFSALVDVVAEPVIADGVVYGVNHNGQMVAFALKTGQRLWQVDVSAISMPWVAGNMVYVVSDDGNLVAIHRTTGRVRYVKDLNILQQKIDETDDRVNFSGPILAGDRLLVANTEGYAFSLNPQDGSLIAAVELPDGSSLSPVVVNNSLYFLTDNGTLICFR